MLHCPAACEHGGALAVLDAHFDLPRPVVEVDAVGLGVLQRLDHHLLHVVERDAAHRSTTQVLIRIQTSYIIYIYVYIWIGLLYKYIEIQRYI